MLEEWRKMKRTAKATLTENQIFDGLKIIQEIVFYFFISVSFSSESQIQMQMQGIH